MASVRSVVEGRYEAQIVCYDGKRGPSASGAARSGRPATLVTPSRSWPTVRRAVSGPHGKPATGSSGSTAQSGIGSKGPTSSQRDQGSAGSPLTCNRCSSDSTRRPRTVRTRPRRSTIRPNATSVTTSARPATSARSHRPTLTSGVSGSRPPATAVTRNAPRWRRRRSRGDARSLSRSSTLRSGRK